MKRLLDRHGYPADLALAGFLLAAGAATRWDPGWMFSLQLAVISLLAFRRKAPLEAAFAAGIFLAGQTIVEGPGQAESASVPEVASILILNYSVAAYAGSFRAAVLGGAILLVGASADLLLYGTGNDDFWMFRILFMVFTWATGWTLHNRGVQVQRLETEAERLAREERRRAQQAVASERARLARELHDVIAHNVSMIAIQAAAADQVLDRHPGKAREPLQNIQSAARQTIDELRRLLGVLRTEDAEESAAPQPTMDDVEPLVERFRRTGLDIEMAVEGNRRRLPASLELSAFRILQEALTNGLKHAPRAHFRLEVRYGAEALEIAVENDQMASGRNGPPGYGLAGMRERVQLLGGSLEAGPSPEGGFALRAMLPLERGAV